VIVFALATQWLVAGAAFIVAVALLFAWLKTGRKALLIGVAVVAVAGVGTLAAAALIVTDKERVENEIYDVAKDVERNDLDAVIDHIHADAQTIIQDAKNRLPSYNFDGVLVRFRRVEIDETQSPRTAKAHFIVDVSGTHKSSSSPIPNGAKGYFEVELVEEGDRWLIRGYRVGDFIEAFQKPK
jgi:hypothetical protein